MDVREYVEAHAAEFSAALREWLAIPSVSADPARHDDVRRSARWLADLPDGDGLPGRRGMGDRGAARRLRALARQRPGCPAGPRLRAPRRPAGGPGGRLGLRAVRAGRAGRQDLRPGCLRRQGPGAVPRARRARPHLAASRRDRATGIDHAPDRGRGGVRLAALRRASRASAREQLSPDVIVISDTTMWAADVPSICTGMRGLADAEITLHGPDTGPALGLVRRRRPQPGARPGQPARRIARRGRPGHAARASTTTSCRSTEAGARAASRRLPFDEKSWLADAGDSQAVAGERRLHHAGADLGAADRRGQRHLGRAHRPRRQDHHPEGRARQAVLPAGRRPEARARSSPRSTST